MIKVVLLLLSVFSVVDLSAATTQEKIDQALALYCRGEKETTVEGRRQAFNRALVLYAELEQDVNHPDLDYNIANTYFQLEEYPLSIYYYYKVLKSQPRNPKAHHNLEVALKKVGVKADDGNTTFKRFLFFHHYLSTHEKLQLFFVFGLFSFVCLSIYIWYRKDYIRKLFWISGIAACLALGIAVWGQYFSPVEGVIVHSSMMHRDAGKQYALVDENPLFGGMKVEVIEVLQEGKWMKIQTDDGVFGFVPSEVIRVL